MTEHPIPEFDRSETEAFGRCVARRRPAIVRGLASEWPARSRWTPAWLADYFGDRPLPVARIESGVVDYSSRGGLKRVAMSVSQFLSEMQSDAGAEWYLSPLVEEHCPELLADVEEPLWCRAASYRSSRLWLGPGGLTTPIHVEVSDNLLAQLNGKKRVRLYGMGQSWRLYPNSPWSGVPHYSRVNPVAPDPERFPRFAGCRRLHGEIGPGDIVLIPRGWWHEVTSLTPSVSVNFWWANGLAALPPRLAAAYRRWRSVAD